MKKINFLSLLTLLVISVFFSSCQKENETVSMQDSVIDEDIITAYFDEILEEADEITYVDEIYKTGSFSTQGITGSRNVETSFSGDTTIHTITFEDFVNTNSPNERVKNGMVVIKVLGSPSRETFWRQVELVDYMVNDAQVEGTKLIEKTADHAFTMTLTNGMVTFADGSSYSREFNRTREQVAGTDTPFFIWDDEFQHEGTASGTNLNGETYSRTVTEPLLKRRNCRWIVQGTVEIVVGTETAVLDYGEGICDREATITVNGETNTIQLRNRFRNRN
ncbi:MAG: hypothetical protein ACOCYO_06370 [Bacteroidota bacterium]